MVQTALTMRHWTFLSRFRSQNSWLSLVHGRKCGTNLASQTTHAVRQRSRWRRGFRKCIFPLHWAWLDIAHVNSYAHGVCCMHQNQTKSCSKHIFRSPCRSMKDPLHLWRKSCCSLAQCLAWRLTIPNSAWRLLLQNYEEHRYQENLTNPCKLILITLLGSKHDKNKCIL